MAKNLPTRCILHRVLYKSKSPYGTPYAVALVIDPDGQEHTALACGNRFGDLDQLHLLEGHEIGLNPTHNGLQVKPLTQQPGEVQQLLVDLLDVSDSQTSSNTQIPDLTFQLSDPSVDEFSRLQDQDTAMSSRLKELVTTIARVSRDLGVATAMWIHFP